MPRSATPPGAIGTRRSNRSRALELTDQKEQATVAQQFLQAAADGLATGAVSALRKTLPAGLRPAASRSPRSKSKGRKEETVRRHSAHASTKARSNTGGSASAFLFNDERSERRASSISAATEAAVQAIATEILEAQDVAAVQRKAAPQSSQDLCQALAPRTEPPDPWASSESDAESDASQKESSASASATLSAPALQDQATASISTIRSRGSSSRQSAEPEGEPLELQRSRGREPREPRERDGGPRQSSASPTDAARLHRALSQVQTCASKGHFSEAIQACLPALHGPQEVVDIVGSLLAAWQASIKKQKRAARHRHSQRESLRTFANPAPRSLSTACHTAFRPRFTCQEQQDEMEALVSEA
ncbi:unnamed protein product [Symbiodinium sp. CCMP2592]|nr:unnamed protein product [Symbiodinium sp. CCMP2592]